MTFTFAKEAEYFCSCQRTALRQGGILQFPPWAEKRASGVARRVPEPFRRTTAACIMSLVTSCGKQVYMSRMTLRSFIERITVLDCTLMPVAEP